MKNDRSRLVIIGFMAALALLSRFIPHPANFVPMAALALIAGREINHRFVAMGLTMVLMVVSDLFLGFASSSAFVYAGFLLVGAFSMGLFKNGSSPSRWILAPLGSSLIFFVVSNFGVWLVDGLYAKTIDGLVSCYVMALPFYHLSLLGDLFYWSVFSGVLALASQRLNQPVSSANA